ncbi:MAG TPA: GntR family transcriptional regulator [Thermomicrobiaceae bacterium]|nr:GntR family transcriptional regulator [Thermomicrobiaceae bacterium]
MAATRRARGEGAATGGPVLSEAAYHQIKRAIIRCELEPGRPVTEEQLAARYGVGRAAVRAALKRLFQEQLIQNPTRNRYVIAPITLRHITELFDVRLLLEPASARLAAGRVAPELLARLRELSGSRYVVGDHDSATAFLSVNTEFHALVAEASGNQLLAGLVRDLLDKVERVQHLGHLLRDRNEAAVHEHHELVEALAVGDGPRAERVMADQIRDARAFVIEALMLSPNVQSVNVLGPIVAGGIEW